MNSPQAGPNSRRAFDRACRLMPGGVNSPARAFGAVGGSPLFIERAEGPYLFDIDGRRYLDYIVSWGPMILGHAHPEVIAAITEAAARGTSFGAPTERESELAERIVAAVPSIDKVRLVNSGTEATMSAIRVARGFTGRDKIIKFAGNYHGHVDALLVSAGSAAATLGVPDSPGVTAGAGGDTIVLPFNDAAALAATFEKFPGQIAAIILEPVVGNMGCVPPVPGFLEAARELTAADGAVLIFDEVMTGFRLAYGGAQERFGITPDMTTLGKVVGGGMPLGAYGGREEIMNCVLPAGKVFQAGTLSGNPVAVAAGNATLRLLEQDPPYAELERLGKRLADGLAEAASAAGLPHQVQQIGSMLTLFFNPHPVHDWGGASKSDSGRFGRFFWGMIERGIYLPCSQYEALFFSRTHTEAMIDETIAAAKEVCAAL
ncbi:glutamate-1-semialdehyde 2,1-aminomutase [Candidatus Laterigemmans baculatus]|uniref:glutamate-1-semialdehyde 2,1-aminomutase n=1 Tax=Candidatus Laterigemmans baculatus TaxID=2770505 RepID=UPI0036F30C4B